MPVLLVGNKWDMDTDGSVIEAAQDYAVANGLPHLVVSAKTGERVQDAFVGISRLLMAERLPELAAGAGKGKGPRDLVPHEPTSSSLFDCCRTS